MSWRERQEKASFKGVSFYVEGHSASKGRRVAVRALPGSSKDVDSVQQDLGRAPNEFDIEAFLWGDDYDADRDELEETLCEPGPGALVLPSRGEQWVRVTRGPNTTESKERGGYCRIRFTVVVEDRTASAARKASPFGTKPKLVMLGKGLGTYGTNDFLDFFDTAGMPAKYIKSTVDAVHNVTAQLKKVQRITDSTVNSLDSVSSLLSELDNTINTIMSSPSALASKLVAIVQGTFSILDTITGNIDRLTGLPSVLASQFDRSGPVRNTLRAGRSIAALGRDVSAGGSTSLAAREAANTRAVYRLARAAAVGSQVQTYATAPFDSSTLALQVLSALGDEFDNLAGYGTGDDLYQALSDVRAALTEHLTQTAADLPRTALYRIPQETPFLLIAHDLYADASRADEVVARNSTRHPLLMSGSVEIVAPEGSGLTLQALTR